MRAPGPSWKEESVKRALCKKFFDAAHSRGEENIFTIGTCIDLGTVNSVLCPAHLTWADMGMLRK